MVNHVESGGGGFRIYRGLKWTGELQMKMNLGLPTGFKARVQEFMAIK